MQSESSAHGTACTIARHGVARWMRRAPSGASSLSVTPSSCCVMSVKRCCQASVTYGDAIAASTSSCSAIHCWRFVIGACLSVGSCGSSCARISCSRKKLRPPYTSADRSHGFADAELFPNIERAARESKRATTHADRVALLDNGARDLALRERKRQRKSGGPAPTIATSHAALASSAAEGAS